jgi:ankyrin repeat protein
MALRFAAGGYDLCTPAPLDSAERLNLGADPARSLGGRAGFLARDGAGPRSGGDASRVRYLLEQGCWADETDYEGVTVLAETVMTGDPARVATLIEYGASPDPAADALLAVESDGAWTVHLDLRVPLFAAAASGVAVLAQLVEGGAHLRLRDARNNTALYFARDAETARWLVAAGLDLEQRITGDRTPLMVAVDEGDVARAKALLLAGANRVLASCWRTLARSLPPPR